MGHEVADGDVLLAVLREIWKVSGHRIGKADSALLYQLHDRGGCRDALGEGGEIEDRIDCHCFVRWFERAGPERFAVKDFAIVTDDQHCAGNVVFRNGVFDDRVDKLETAFVVGLCLGGEAHARTAYKHQEA